MKVDTSKAPSWAHSYGEYLGNHVWMADTHYSVGKLTRIHVREDYFNANVKNVTRFKRYLSFFDDAPDWAHSHGFLDGRDVWFDDVDWLCHDNLTINTIGSDFHNRVGHVTRFKAPPTPPVTADESNDDGFWRLMGVTTPSTSVEFLQQCIDVQAERGKQYDPKGDKERSFATVASMFNEVRSTELKGSDICLILEFVKLVRQYADPSRVHDDSLLDKVSYSSLWAEELKREHE